MLLKYNIHNEVQTTELNSHETFEYKQSYYTISIRCIWSDMTKCNLLIKLDFGYDEYIYSLDVIIPVIDNTADISMIDLFKLHTTPLVYLLCKLSIDGISLYKDMSHIEEDLCGSVDILINQDVGLKWVGGKSIIAIKNIDNTSFESILTLEQMNNNMIHKQYLMILEDRRYALVEIISDTSGRIKEVQFIKEVQPNEEVTLHHNALGIKSDILVRADKYCEHYSEYRKFGIHLDREELKGQFEQFKSDNYRKETPFKIKTDKDFALKAVLRRLINHKYWELNDMKSYKENSSDLTTQPSKRKNNLGGHFKWYNSRYISSRPTVYT